MLSVVVPTFNEGKNIRNLVTQINDALKGIDYEILFVDDSKDNTPEVIMEVAKDFPQVRMEHRTGETGLATAVLRGFELTLRYHSQKRSSRNPQAVQCFLSSPFNELIIK